MRQLIRFVSLLTSETWSGGGIAGAQVAIHYDTAGQRTEVDRFSNASGTALVATRAGALPEVTGDAARLVPPGDPEELAAALRELLDDEAARERLGALGLARVRERITKVNPLDEQNFIKLAHTLRQLGRVDAARARLK